MNPRTAMFPGTFDPVTYGHIDIIKRSSRIFDKVYVVLAININKKTMFTVEERLNMLKEVLTDCKNVEITVWQGLTVDFAKQNDVGVIIRGVRAIDDFSYETEVAQINKSMLPGLDVVFLPSSIENSLIRSSSVKSLAVFGADVSNMVPEVVAKQIAAKQKC